MKKRVAERGRSSKRSRGLTCVGGPAGVPDEDASVIRRAGEHVVVDGVDGQAVDGVNVQEHVQSLPPAHGDNNAQVSGCTRRHRREGTQSTFHPPLHVVKDHLFVVT